ncbi:hypothetical protein ACFR9T_13785 [Halorubrum laminariae]|uniref:DUF7096 domain-containing protein n=2 Tax=Halorubrum laminariae TaxID=1433523 RepID=A0ABD6C390_9EURY
MNRGTAPVVAVVIAVAVVGLIGVAAAGPVGVVTAQDDPGTNETDTDDPGTNETNSTAGSDDAAAVSPGERFSGVVGVQQAEIDGEVSSRSFEVALDRTDSDAERAAVVAERLNRTDDRLTTIERRQRELRERRDAGELSQGAFAARMAELGARAESERREANQSADVAEQLPASARAERGLDEERLNAVRERASDLSGPEVAAIARGIGGNETGSPLAADRRGPLDRRGPPNGTTPGPDGGVDRGNGTAAPNGTAPSNVANSSPPNATGDTRRSPASGAESENASDAGRSDRFPGEDDADGPSRNGSDRDGGSASDGVPERGDSDDSDGSDGSDDSDEEPGAGASDRGGSGGGDGSSGGSSNGGGSNNGGSGGDATPGRDRPSLGPVDAAGSFLQNAWSDVVVASTA